MTYIAGDEQTSTVDPELPGSARLRLSASMGWASQASRSASPRLHVALAETTVITDAEGYARNTVVLGPVPGPQTLRGHQPGMPTVTFRATAHAGAAIRLTATRRRQPGGGRRTDPPRRAKRAGQDAAGNFIPGVPVTWEVVEGRRSAGAGRHGNQPQWRGPGIYRLGTLPSTNSMRVTAAGLQDCLSTSGDGSCRAGPRHRGSARGRTDRPLPGDLAARSPYW